MYILREFLKEHIKEFNSYMLSSNQNAIDFLKAVKIDGEESTE